MHIQVIHFFTQNGRVDSPTLSSDVERAIKYGPCQYVPEPEEWIHEFCWHGSDPGDKTSKTYGALVFNKLRTIADQMYYNVRANNFSSFPLKG